MLAAICTGITPHCVSLSETPRPSGLGMWTSAQTLARISLGARPPPVTQYAVGYNQTKNADADGPKCDRKMGSGLNWEALRREVSGGKTSPLSKPLRQQFRLPNGVDS
jgi:hypothetical protein